MIEYELNLLKRRDGAVEFYRSDHGCGCCSGSETAKDLKDAIKMVNEYIEECKYEIAHWEAWLEKATAAGKIVA